MIRLKRVYDAAAPDDGFRLLVDRLWPRGVAKTRVDAWLREIAPSDALRTWFGHEEHRWDAFKSRYHLELAENDAVPELRSILAEHDVVTFLFATRETRYNNAVALKDFVESSQRASTPPEA